MHSPFSSILIEKISMNHQIVTSNSTKDISALFTSVFTSSEGQVEGQAVGSLAGELSEVIDNKSILCFATYEENSIIGCLFFTQLYFKHTVSVFMLSPVAVSTSHQGKGIGQSLINFSLSELKSRAVDVAITYGDPSFYSKVGFSSLAEEVLQAPLTLSMPEGWLGMSLTESEIPQLNEKPTCIEAFNKPSLW